MQWRRRSRSRRPNQRLDQQRKVFLQDSRTCAAHSVVSANLCCVTFSSFVVNAEGDPSKPASAAAASRRGDPTRQTLQYCQLDTGHLAHPHVILVSADVNIIHQLRDSQATRDRPVESVGDLSETASDCSALQGRIRAERGNDGNPGLGAKRIIIDQLWCSLLARG